MLREYVAIKWNLYLSKPGDDYKFLIALFRAKTGEGVYFFPFNEMLLPLTPAPKGFSSWASISLLPEMPSLLFP